MPSIRDEYAKAILKRHHARIGVLPHVRRPPSEDGPIKVGIIGAGAAGLYAAMILEMFKSYGYTYEILEAEPEKIVEKHVGGRLWTHKFSQSPNDYYDRGAMRFPDIDFMQRVFDLFDRLDLKRDGLLINYVMSIPNNILFYNGIKMTVSEYQSSNAADPFKIGLASNAEDYTTGAFGDFKNRLTSNFDQGWDFLMQYDEYSTRDYMRLVLKTYTTPSGKVLEYTDNVITALETLESSTSLYDCALSESVMDSLDFDNPKPVSWYCIQGGAEEIARRMAASLTSGIIQRGKRVTAFAPVLSEESAPTSMQVSVAGENTPRKYSHVISTIPLSCLSMVDTTQCNLPWNIQTAIRAMHYDSAVKVAIKFFERWWEKAPYSQLGGVSSTDRPTRVVIYPSYGIGGSDATIIVSYTWAQDALRFGAFARGEKSPAEQALLDVIFKDLADMHGNGLTAASLRNMMVSHEVWSWYNHEHSAGAFALFGPGQFSNLYPELTAPPAGLLHFAGEATSVHHAWVIGALNSAYRCIHEIFVHEGRSDLVKILQEQWGKVDEIDDPLLKQQVALGQHRF